MGRLDGKVAIVTGASRGIGKAVATVFAAEGASVVCAARTVHEGDQTQGASLATTVAGIEQAGGRAVAVQADMSEEESCLELVAKAKNLYGPADVLVNNAVLTYDVMADGTTLTHFIPVMDIPAGMWQRSFSANLHGPFILSQAVLRDMVPRKSGAIVNISSGAAIGPGRGPYPSASGRPTLYGTAKAALERFTQGLAEEVYQHGISVSCVSPSHIVPTPGTVFHKLVNGMEDPCGEPPEMMAKAALLLASEPPDKVTGRVTYSQQILQEFGWIREGSGMGIDQPGSGYSQI